MGGKRPPFQPASRSSLRATRPLVTVNTGGLAEGIFESELFGHVKGAFVGRPNEYQRPAHVLVGTGLDDRASRPQLADPPQVLGSNCRPLLGCIGGVGGLDRPDVLDHETFRNLAGHGPQSASAGWTLEPVCSSTAA